MYGQELKRNTRLIVKLKHVIQPSWLILAGLGMFLVWCTTFALSLETDRPDAAFLRSWSDGDTHTAYVEITSLVDRFPANELYQLNRGILLFHLDSLAAARQSLLELVPAERYFASRRHYYLGRLARRTRDDQLAVSRFRMAWKLNPSDLKPLEEAVEVSYAFPHPGLCRKLVAELLQEDQENWTGLRFQGLLQQEEHPRAAVESLRASVASFPHPTTLLELIRLLEGLPGGLMEAEQLRWQLQQYYPDPDSTLTGAVAKQDECSTFFPVGTQYVYSVSYGFIPLGTLKIWTQRYLTVAGERLAEVWFTADVNPLYAWLIDMHDIFVARMPLDASGLRSMYTSSIYNDDIMERLYQMETGSNHYFARGCHYEGDIYLYRYPCPRGTFDGISILYAARRSVRLNQSARYTTIVSEEFKRTEIQLDPEPVQLRHAGSYHSVRRLHGTANYKGQAGLSGNFEGWFTNDSLTLPLESKMKIMVGSITIRLKEIKQL